MTYCPNCSAELKSALDPVCWNCQAIFTDPTGWQPTERPVGNFRPFAVKKAPGVEPAASGGSSTEIKIVKAIITIPLCLFGVLLMRFGLGQIGVLLLVLALAVWASSTTVTKAFSMGASLVALFLVMAGIYLVGLAIRAR